MKRHRFILPYAAFRASHLEVDDAALSHQLRDVLKVRIGEEVILCDGDDTDVVATLRGYKGDVISFDIGEHMDVVTGAPRAVTMYIAITKRDTFEWACQKATECGVTCIVPVLTERTVKQNLNLERLRVIVKEAAEQSGRASIPEVGEIVSFADVLSVAEGIRLIAAVGATTGQIDDCAQGNEPVSIAIGPEGGFSEREVGQALEAGWQSITLGERVLRAETAVVVTAFLATR